MSEVIANYEIVEKLGKGTTGDVYKANPNEQKLPNVMKILNAELKDNETFTKIIRKHFWKPGNVERGRQELLAKTEGYVALKLFEKALGKDEDFIKNFQQYFDQASELYHENLIFINCLDKFRGRLYMVMEYIVGETVKKEISVCGAYFEPTACRIVYQVANGLDYMHGLNIAHTKITPSSIFLTHDGKAKLDLELAKSSRDLSWDFDIKEREAIFQKDIYDLGKVFYAMLTGKMDSDDMVAEEVGASEETRQVLSKMLDSETPYQDFEELIIDIEEKNLLTIKF